MQLQFLRTLKIPAAVRIRLGELPKDLRDTYDEIYKLKVVSDVEEQSSVAESAFKLLLALQTSLGHRDFLHALSFCSVDEVHLSTEELLDLCCNFLVLDNELDVFRFAHLSVREYLETKSEYSPESSHALAAQFCLRYLCTSNASGPFLIPRDPWPNESAILGDTNRSGIGPMSDSRVMSWKIAPALFENYSEKHPPRWMTEYPFLDRVQQYTCTYWADHAAGSRHLRLLHPLNTMLRDFIMDAPEVVSPWFMYWNRLAIQFQVSTRPWDRDWIFKRTRPLVPESEWRTRTLVPESEWVFDRTRIVDMTHVPADYLFTASVWGFCDLLEYRLDSNPDPLLIRCMRADYDALQLACIYGNYDVAVILIDRGWGLQVENPELLLGLAIEGLLNLERRSSLPTLAIDDKYTETIELLISRGLNPNEEVIFPTWKQSAYPILMAIEVLSTRLVKILLACGASPDVGDGWGLKSFHRAALMGQQDIVELLLAASTDADDFPRTFWREVVAVLVAVERSDEILLITALGKWPQDPRGRKYLDLALRNAVMKNNIWPCMKALLDKGADANMRRNGESIIELCSRCSWAGQHGDIKMQLLLDHGAILEEGKMQLLLGHGSVLEEEEQPEQPNIRSDQDDFPISIRRATF